MPDDQVNQNLPSKDPSQGQASQTTVQPQGQGNNNVNEQASLDALAEKLAKWKEQIAVEEVNKYSGQVIPEQPKEQVQKVQSKYSSEPVKKKQQIKSQVENSASPTTTPKGSNIKKSKEQTVTKSEKVQVPKSENAGVSVSPQNVVPKVDQKEAIEQFEQEVQQASKVKSETYPKDIRKLLELAKERNASDLHITVGYPPVLRVDGKLVHIGNELVTSEMAEKLIFPTLAESKRDLLEVNREVDVAYELEDVARFRVNVYHEKGRLAAAFRLIPSRIKTLEELNLPKILRRFTKLNQGFILITGPTGHGKTTTLASMLQEINKNYEKHIITIEDPIEYVYPKAKALISQREMHEDTHSWEIALRSAMREDPDVVLVGEMRDYETISSAITLAETGHLVFATLHTNSSSQTIDRIIDVFPDNQQRQVRSQLATIIEGVVSQRLIPIRTGGRRPACEILLSTPAVRNLIREEKIYQINNVIRTSLDVGMTSMENSLVQMVREGLISVEQAEEYAIDPEEVIRLLR